jgi:hypothetical protein
MAYPRSSRVSPTPFAGEVGLFAGCSEHKAQARKAGPVAFREGATTLAQDAKLGPKPLERLKIGEE